MDSRPRDVSVGWTWARSAHTTMITGCRQKCSAKRSPSDMVRSVFEKPVCTALGAPSVPAIAAAPARAAPETSRHNGRYHSPSCRRSAGSRTNTNRTAPRFPPLGANRASSTAW